MQLEDNKRDQIVIQINTTQRVELEEIKRIMDLKSDARAIKELAWIGKNAMVMLLGDAKPHYLFKKDRARLGKSRDFPER